jgi:hypothetical protein
MPKQEKLPAELTTMLPGTPVRVRLDSGEFIDTVTTSICWRLGHGQWVVKTNATGAGGYALNRCMRIPEDPHVK